MAENNTSDGEEKISQLKQAFEEVHNGDNRSQEELTEITKKLKDAYKDKEIYWQQKVE